MEFPRSIALTCSAIFFVACDGALLDSVADKNCEMLSVRNFDFTGRLWEYVDTKYDNQRVPFYFPDIGERLCVDFTKSRSYMGVKYHPFESQDIKFQSLNMEFWLPETYLDSSKMTDSLVKEIRIPVPTYPDIKNYHLPYLEIYLPAVGRELTEGNISLMVKQVEDQKTKYFETEINCKAGQSNLLAAGNQIGHFLGNKKRNTRENLQYLEPRKPERGSLSDALIRYACEEK